MHFLHERPYLQVVFKKKVKKKKSNEGRLGNADQIPS